MDSDKMYRTTMYAALSTALYNLQHAQTSEDRRIAQREYDDLVCGITEYNRRAINPITARQIGQALGDRLRGSSC